MTRKLFEVNYRYFLPRGVDENRFADWCRANLSEKAMIYSRTVLVRPFVSTSDEDDITMLHLMFGQNDLNR